MSVVFFVLHGWLYRLNMTISLHSLNFYPVAAYGPELKFSTQIVTPIQDLRVAYLAVSLQSLKIRIVVFTEGTL